VPNPSWQPGTLFAQYAVIIDGNGNVEQCVQSGQTGNAEPVWPLTVGTRTSDGGAQWICVAVLASSPAPAGIAGLPPPVFINDADGLDPLLVLNDMIAAFEAAAGRTLYPAQVEMLLINLYAYREAVVRAIIQWAGEQSLLAFAQYPNLDYLGQLLGVNRLAAQPATTTIQFTLTAAQVVETIIPQGTLVGTNDGLMQFATDGELAIPAGQTQGSIGATATTPGIQGNGYLAGTVNVQLNPNALVASAANTTTTGGGSAIETDAHLRARIQAAPNQFSSAGPTGAYRFFALSVDPAIIDAQVVSPNPGAVNVYVLTGPIDVQPAASPNSAGIANATLLAAVEAALSADDVRPLTDTVTALAVTEVDYQVTGTVELYANADVASVMAAANQAAQDLALELAGRIQRDIVPEEFIAAIGGVPGVYRVTLTAPAYTQLTAGQWANCTAITLTQTSATEDM
jgi:phage-related baseplate assembly protein